MLRGVCGRCRAHNDNGLKGRFQQFAIRRVGSADAGRKGSAVAFDQQAFLDARLAEVTEIGADALLLRSLFPTPLPGTLHALPK